MSDRSQDANKKVEMFNGAAKAHLNGASEPVENSGSGTPDILSRVTKCQGYPGQNVRGVCQAPKSEPDRSSADADVENSPLNQYQEPKSHYFKTLNQLADVLLQMLNGAEFKIYFRLYRLSHGFKQTTCFVGHPALAEACNLSVRQVQRVVPRLVALGLVRILAIYNSPEKKGTLYEVFTSGQQTPLTKCRRRPADTPDKMSTNKGKDDSDKRNHHQRQTMAIFTELTGRVWTKADAASYRKVAEVPIEKLEFFLRLIHKRALEPVRSFAFFAASVQNELAAAASGQGAAAAGPAPGGLKQKYQKFAAEIRAVYLGGSLSVSALIDKLKGRCIREGVPWNDDVANEVFGV